MRAFRSALAAVSAVGMCAAISIVVGPGTVSAEATVEGSISVTQPFGVAVDEARSRLFVTNPAQTEIRVYDSNNLTLLGFFFIGRGAHLFHDGV